MMIFRKVMMSVPVKCLAQCFLYISSATLKIKGDVGIINSNSGVHVTFFSPVPPEQQIIGINP